MITASQARKVANTVNYKSELDKVMFEEITTICTRIQRASKEGLTELKYSIMRAILTVDNHISITRYLEDRGFEVELTYKDDFATLHIEW